ncbi:MAG: hypothetical protein ACTHQQ_18280, partial [Solirubrobacteraceae bacterium]
SATVVASASAATAARLRGTFTMQGRITVADDVRGEHAGQRVHRSWTFYPRCKNGACKQVVLKRRRSARGILDTMTLNRQGPGVYRGWSHFWMALECNGRVVHHAGVAAERITVRITRAALAGKTRYATGITASYFNPYRHQYTRCPGIIGHDSAAYAGHLAVKAIAATGHAGYLVMSADGAIFHFGAAASHGDEAGSLPSGRHAVSMAVDKSTGGYWILNSGGGVRSFSVPREGSLAGKLHGTRAVAIAASGTAGYLILTSNGGVHPFGNAGWHGSHNGKLPRGVHAVSLAVNKTGGYWVLNSNGGVAGFGTHAMGSLRGKLSGHRAIEITAGSHDGYLILTGNGGVHPFGNATGYGGAAGKLPHGVSAVSSALDPKTGGYWMLLSHGGVKAFHAPWEGSLG